MTRDAATRSMKLYAFHSGGERADWASIDPFSPRAGTQAYLPYFFYLIDHPLGRVLFDTGAHPSLAEDPRARLGEEADNWEIQMGPEDNLVDQLATVGLRPGDIDHVVLSHLHYDHCGGIESLPHARFYVQQDELIFANWPPVYQRGLYVRADFDHDVNWVELNGSHDLFGDGRVTVFPTIGHTRGHQSLIAHLDDSTVILVGDAAYLPSSLENKALPAVLWSPDEMVSSWNTIDRLHDQHDAILLFTHDIDFATSVRTAPDYYS